MSETVTKHYVIFYSPGTLFSETSERPIEAYDVDLALAMSRTITERHGSRPYGFCFITMLEHAPIKDKSGEVFTVSPKETARSGMFFINGQVLTLAEAKEQPNSETLVHNMEYNDRETVVTGQSRYRWTMAWKAGDCIVSELPSGGLKIIKFEDVNGKPIASG